MPNWLKHTGLFIAGAACVVGGVFFPPASALLGPLGAKLIVMAGAAALVGVHPDVVTGAIKDAATTVKGK